MAIVPGTRLGPYEITSALDAGGMGEVYRAVDTRLDRGVAVKILPSDFAANAQFRLRFEREAKLISSLTHPHICTLHDVGEANGVRYLVMELLAGETLAQRIARGPLPLAELLTIATQIASGLDKAHRQGVVHRDLKPANVMLTRSGVKLLDFGLAKTAGAVTSLSPADATEQKPLTAEGTIVGTFQYMAPEQLEGADADPRSDIFAFGAVLYEMATGRRAFEGKTRTSLIAAIVQGQPAPISTVQPLTPPAFERLVAACLAKDPDDRLQSMHDVLLQLRWIADGAAEAKVAAPAPRRPVAPWLAVVAAVAIGAALATWALMRREQPRPSYSFTIPTVTPQYQNVGTVKISPDGKKLAFDARDAQGVRYVWVQSLDSFEVRKIEATQHGFPVCWSPDSRSVFVSRQGGLARVAAEGGAAQPVIGRTASTCAMSSEGVFLVSQSEAPIMRVDTATGQLRAVTTFDPKYGEFSHTSPQILPDGKRFLYVARTSMVAESARTLRLYAGSVDGGPSRYLGDVPSMVAYADPGYVLYVRAGALVARRFDPETLEFKSDPQVVLDSVAIHTAAAAFSVSRNGVLAALPQRRQYTVRRVDGTGRIVAQIGSAEATAEIRMARDGERVAVSVADLNVGTFDLWAFGVSRPTRERIIVHGAHDQAPVWSRDGSQIYFSTDRLGYADVFVTPSDGSTAPRLVIGGGGMQTPYDVSPDGTQLLYASSGSGTSAGGDLYATPLAGGKARPFVAAPRTQGDGRFSPDGRLVAYLSDETGATEVYVRAFPGPGRAHPISTAGASQPPVWSRDGRTLFFCDRRTVFRATIDPRTGEAVGEPQQMFEMPYDVGSWDLASDGTFVMTLATEERDSPPLRVVTDWQRLLAD